MWHGSDCLFYEHAFLGDREVDPSCSLLASDTKMIALGVVSEEGEHETILPPGGTMSGSGITTGFEEDRHDIEVKTDWSFFHSIFYCNGQFNFPVLKSHGKR